MTDPRFAELRSEIERNTILPEFSDVSRRARKYRRNKRVTAIVGSLSAAVVLLPGLTYLGVVLGGSAGRPGLVQITVANGGNSNATVVDPSPTPRTTVQLVAAAGVDMAHAYGLVDVCQLRKCSLQLIALGAKPSTERIGLLRADASQSLADPRLVALGKMNVIVSGQVAGGIAPKPQPLDLGPIFTEPGSSKATDAAVPVQEYAFDPIKVAQGSDGVLHVIATQPGLRSPVLAATAGGWWVTGNDPRTGELSVAVSRDQGSTWHTTALGVLADETPSMATADGRTVYVLVRSAGQILLMKSTNGGASWGSSARDAAWDPSRQYGVMAQADGSVDVWLADSGGNVTYRRSTNGGTTFTPVTGSSDAPTGQVVTLPGGYVSLGAHPALSTDGRAWHTVSLPIVPPG